jgi:hypothetical protein
MSAESTTNEPERPDLDPKTVASIIACSRPEDYDGHTEFERLSPKSRLEWLESAVRFIELARRARVKRGDTV